MPAFVASPRPEMARANRMIRLHAGALAAVRSHAAATYPEECCGALLGVVEADAAGETAVGAAAATAVAGTVTQPRRILRAVPVDNAWTGARGERYLIPADVVRTIEADARRAGLEIVGFYHSHPDGAAEPSAFDLEVAWPWYCYLIIVAGAGGAGIVRGWRLHDDRAGFEELVLVNSGASEFEEGSCR